MQAAIIHSNKSLNIVSHPIQNPNNPRLGRLASTQNIQRIDPLHVGRDHLYPALVASHTHKKIDNEQIPSAYH
jgi:hypothetical protein